MPRSAPSDKTASNSARRTPSAEDEVFGTHPSSRAWPDSAHHHTDEPASAIALDPYQEIGDCDASQRARGRSAAHSITQALRAELRDRGITVLGAYPGSIDTDMLAGVEVPKAPPEVVAERVIASLAAGQTIVFPDDTSASAGSVYLSDPVRLEHLPAG
jgi:NAD(P)-dependent dehydrogenase (short-subunit alcohol dehydrogenase family)